MVDLVSLAVALAIPLGVGAAGGITTAKSIPVWYRGLKKPSWNPPDRLFGPVWTTLYVLMGLGSWLVWGSGLDSPGVRLGLLLYGFQLLLNLLWSLVFFGLRRIEGALVVIGTLWVLILATLIQFYLVQSVAGLLLLPYLVWVSIATVLNTSIWNLNKARP